MAPPVDASWRWLPRGAPLDEQEWERRHRVVVAVLALHVPVLTAWMVVSGAVSLHSFFEAAFPAVAAAAAWWLPAGTRLRAAVGTLGLVGTSAVVVHAGGGGTELHFHFFAVIGLVALYQDWTTYLSALAFVVGHHLAAGFLAPEAVFSDPASQANPVRATLIHAGFIAGASVAALVAWRCNEEALALRADQQAEAAVQEERRRRALELHDSVIQGLVVSLHSLDDRDLDYAQVVLGRTLVAARSQVSDLLRGSDGEVHLRPGELTRRVAATVKT